MRKIALTVGLAAVGTVGLHAQDSSSMQTSKIWSLSGTLRGFYDDNYNTAPAGSALRRSSIGFEVSPSFGLDIPLEQTDFGLRYTYGLYYYQDRQDIGSNPIDQSDQFDAWLSHSFSESWQASVRDSLVYSQEPDLALGSGVALRTSGNTLVNTGSIKLDTQWTRLLSSELGYQNTLYHYDNSTYSGELDRLENLASVDLFWQVIPTAKVGIGYQYQQINYTANQVILAGPPKYMSDNRDNRSHFVYANVQYNPLDNLTVALKLGAQITDYYNPPAGVSSTSTTSPYVDLSGTYTYLPGSYVQVGFTQARNAAPYITAASASGQIDLDEESSTIYGSINHQFTPQLVGNINGRIQYSTVNGGANDGTSETWYSLGLNLSYAFNPHISAEIGYNFDDLDSNLPASLGQSYKRNRAYIGITAAY
jgi:hypothetical protein